MAEKPKFGDALRGYRTAAGMTQKQLADAVGRGLRQQNIGEVEKGKRSGFAHETVTAIERALALRPGELAKRLPPDHPAHLKAKLTEKTNRASTDGGRHPFIGTVEAGRGIDEHAGDEWVNLPQECDGADGVYVVNGRSMVGAGILPYDYLVVRRTDTPADGDLVVAWTQDFGAVVKRVRVEARDCGSRGTAFTLLTEGDDKDNRYPYSLNRLNGDRIYAVVIAVFRTYKSKMKPVDPSKGKPATPKRKSS